MLDFMLEKVVSLPIFITRNSRFKVIRIIGILSMFLWIGIILPLIIIIPLVALIEELIKC